MKLSQNLSSKPMACDEGLPSLKKDLLNSLQLLKQCGPNGFSLFDHLSDVIAKVIDERPKNVADHFEPFSERVRLEKFQMNERFIKEDYVKPDRLEIANKLLPRLIEESKQPSKDDVNESLKQATNDDNDEIVHYEPPAKDFIELQFYWNLLGIGFGREEVFLLARSMAQLKTNPKIESCRFWGKILGTKNDYFVVECSLFESKEDSVDHPMNKASLIASEVFVPVFTPLSQSETNAKVTSNDENDNASDFQTEEEKYPADWNFSMKIPESQYLPPIEIPAENNGIGANRMVYFVCNDLGQDWVELPPVTPHQINVSRRIKLYLTGNLDESITSYPPFTGTEKNYLRALIARISASTHISPRNFYKIKSSQDNKEEDDEYDSDLDDDESLDNDKPITQNESYQSLPTMKLLQLDSWEHHKPEILKQGRVTYFDGSLLIKNFDESDDSSDENDEVDEIDSSNKTKPEKPMTLFASCANDRLANDDISPWTIKLSDVVETLVLVQNQVWPGAFAFVKERTSDNIYIGFGHKYSTINYGPPVLPELAAEYPFGPDIVEENDPTVEEEALLSIEPDGKASDGEDGDEENINQ